jgi:hypothetical protein
MSRGPRVAVQCVEVLGFLSPHLNWIPRRFAGARRHVSRLTNTFIVRLNSAGLMSSANGRKVISDSCHILDVPAYNNSTLNVRPFRILSDVAISLCNGACRP